MSHFSRRDFLAAAASTAAVSMLPASSAVKADPLKLPVGVQLYTVSEELKKDLDGTLQKIAAIGYRTVETASFTSNIKATQMREALDRAGLACQSAHYGLPQLLGGAQQAIDDAHQLGAKYVVCSAPWVADMSRFANVAKGNKPEAAFAALMGSFTMDDWRWNAEQFNKAGENLKKAGLQFAYHNHGFEFKKIDGKLAFDELLAMTDPNLVAIEMDCGWVANAGHDPIEYLKRFPNRIQLLHVKDIKRNAGENLSFEMEGTEIGKGILDWPAIFKAAKQAGLKGYFVEQEPPFARPPLEELQASYAYLHKLS
jgi:sugar phosphate isomerase/epimerase